MKRKIKVIEPIILPNVRYYTDEELVNIYTKLLSSSVYFLDVETPETGLDKMNPILGGMGLGTLEEEWYLAKQDIEAMDNMLPKVFADKNKTMVGHNLLFDKHILQKCGYTINNLLWDTKAAAFLYDENDIASKADTLKYLGEKLFNNTETIHFKEVDWTNDVQVKKYGTQDIVLTKKLYVMLKPFIDKNHSKVFYDVYMKLVDPIINIHNAGITIDLPYLEELFWEVKDELIELEQDLKVEISKHTDKELNINSPTQLRNFFYGTLGLEPVNKTKKSTTHPEGQDSTNERALRVLAYKGCQVANLMLRYRGKIKLFGTYLEPIIEKTNKQTGRLYTDYNPYATVTGRWNSSKPNLQNITQKDEGLLRKAFIAEKGSVLLIADYSQIELRLLAHFSQDSLMMKNYFDNADLHAKTASALFGKKESEITDEERYAAKTVNFSVIYGISPFALAENLEISIPKAQEFISKYFRLYSGVARYKYTTTFFCGKDKYVTTLLGRKRHLPDMPTYEQFFKKYFRFIKNEQEIKDRFITSKYGRMSVNAQIQGSAGDILNLAIIELYKKYNLDISLKTSLQVHDELVFSCPVEKAEQYLIDIKNVMENIVKLRVPLLCNVKSCNNWSEK